MLYVINQNICTGCGACEKVCMDNAISNYIDFYLIDPRWCTDCGSCAAICEENAIILSDIEEMKSVSFEEPVEYQLEELQSHF